MGPTRRVQKTNVKAQKGPKKPEKGLEEKRSTRLCRKTKKTKVKVKKGPGRARKGSRWIQKDEGTSIKIQTVREGKVRVQNKGAER